MLAGSLSSLGYFMGDELLSASESNPKGFFEDQEIIRINEALMRSATGGESFSRGRGWLAGMPLHTEIVPRRALLWRMRTQVARAPFCFKDPRFCYTLPAWLPLLGDHVVVCVFREPARTANSVVKECQRRYYRRVEMDFERALRLWTLQYRHVLNHYRAGGTFVFAHYEQVLDGSALARLGTALGPGIDTDFPDVALRRSPATGIVGADVLEIYARLCSFAGYVPETPIVR